jgi:hypothetical protein
MKKYIVKIDNMCTSLLEIEAESKDDARVKAKDFFEHNRDFVLNLKDYYTSTTPHDLWPIIDKNDFEDLQKKLNKEGEAKSNAALLIHRADLIDHRMRIRNSKSLIGTLEEYVLTKKLIDAEQKIESKGLVLDDATKKEVDKMISGDIYSKNNLLKYIDPEARPWKIGELIEAQEKCEIRMKETKIVQKTNFLEDRDQFPEDVVVEMALKAKERAQRLKATRQKELMDSEE